MNPLPVSKPPTGRKMKNPAPPPPGPPQPTPRRVPRNIVPDGGVAYGADVKENVLRPHVELQLDLPDGTHTASIFDGRTALMDLLVEVCGHYHLNPAHHTLELLSSEGQPLAFKPNAFLGSLDVRCAVIKERPVVDDRLVRKPAPKVPEKTVRLVVNYHRSQKTVVRVSPYVPLHALVPLICLKCEFDPAHVLLLRDSVCRHELDLNKTLVDLELRELYALDQSLVLQPKMASAPALNYAESTCSTQSGRSGEKRGLLGLFKFNRRKSKALSSVSGSLCVEARPSTLGQSQSVMNISKMSPKAELKKRRAPVPPPATPQSYASLDVHSGHISTSSLLKKRKAPAPPPTPSSQTPTPTPPTSDNDALLATPTVTSSYDRAPFNIPTSTSTSTTAAATAAAATLVTITAGAAASSMLPPVAAVRRVLPQEDSVSEMSGSSLESGERAAAAFSSSSSQADSIPSSHLDEVAVSSQDEELEEEFEELEDEDDEEEEEEDDDDDMEMEEEMLRQVQVRQTSWVQPATTKPAVVVGGELRMEMGQIGRYSKTPTAMDPRILPVEQAVTQPQRQSKPQPQSQPQSQVQAQVQSKPTQPEEVQQHLDSDRSSTPADSSSTISLSMEETENHRHSGIEAGRQVPVKPRRTSLGDQISHAGSSSPALVDRNSHNASPDSFTDMQPHSWLHTSRPLDGANVPVDAMETGSISSSNGSLPDQGYAEETWGHLGSPSTNSPAHSPYCPGPRDLSSDSDEGCATWNSRTGQDLYQKGQSGRAKAAYNEDPKLMAQVQMTLADLDAELEEINRSNDSETPSETDDVIPVSVVDLVPVTTIDEVLDVPLQSDDEHMSATLSSSTTVISHTKNKNNNATFGHDAVLQASGANQQRSMQNTTHKPRQEITTTKKKKPTSQSGDTHSVIPENRPATKVPSSAVSVSTVPPMTSHPPTASTRQTMAPPSAQAVLTSQRKERTQIKEMPASRFGTRTFTIVPNKVVVPPVVETQPEGSLSLGAIRIDEQGNMVQGRGGWRRGGSSEDHLAEEHPVGVGVSLKDKIRGLSTTNVEKQEAPVSTDSKTLKKTNLNTTLSAITEMPPQAEEPTKLAFGGPSVKPADRKTDTSKSVIVTSYSTNLKDDNHIFPTTQTSITVKEVIYVSESRLKDQDNKLRASENYLQAQDNRLDALDTRPKPQVRDPVDLGQAGGASAHDAKDLSFLKPKMRTSSQYMATALSNRYNVRPTGRADGSSEKSESEFESRCGLKQSVVTPGGVSSATSGTEATTKRSITSSQVEAPPKESSRAPRWAAMRSPPSYKSHTFSKTETSDLPPSRPLQVGTGSALQTDSGAVKSTMTVATNQVSSSRPDAFILPASSTQPDRIQKSEISAGVLPEPNQVSIFGPVKKFRPVIQKSVEKDTSLHSSLMEAIQAGDGKERLRKVSELSAGGTVKKTTLVEEENSHSALLSAIRASDSNRLKKTTSKAAKELNRCRIKEVQSQTTTQASPILPPPPPAPVPASVVSLAPPPPPPPSAAPPTPRTFLVSSSNPEQTREALLEAIRSGAGAKGLKKVPAPTKTLQVNGRLGTIQATSALPLDL